jgi:hypothetical protein
MNVHETDKPHEPKYGMGLGFVLLSERHSIGPFQVGTRRICLRRNLGSSLRWSNLNLEVCHRVETDIDALYEVVALEQPPLQDRHGSAHPSR